MAQHWWRRLLPDGSRLFLFGALAVVVVAVLGFIELYDIKSEAQTDYAAAQAQVEQLNQQHQALQDALGQGQRGENIEPKAREYFKMGRPGEKKLIFATPAPDEPQARPTPVRASASRPVWLRWLDRLLGR